MNAGTGKIGDEAGSDKVKLPSPMAVKGCESLGYCEISEIVSSRYSDSRLCGVPGTLVDGSRC